MVVVNRGNGGDQNYDLPAAAPVLVVALPLIAFGLDEYEEVDVDDKEGQAGALALPPVAQFHLRDRWRCVPLAPLGILAS